MESVKEAPMKPEDAHEMLEERKTSISPQVAGTTVPAADVEKAAEDAGKKRARFAIGALVPINGIWFKIAEVKPKGLFLEAVAYTGKERKK